MRVLHVIPSLSPRRGGPSEAVRRMTEAQRTLGLEAEIACSDEDHDSPGLRGLAPAFDEGVPVHFFSRRFTRTPFLRDYAFCPSFAPWLAAQLASYDLLHVHALFSHLPTTAMRLARRAGVPYLSRPLGQLGRWPLRQGALKKAVYLRLVERRNLEGAAAIHFVSDSERDEAADLRLRASVAVIPHGTTLPPVIAGAPLLLRRKIGVADDRPLILFLGRLHAKKGADLLLRALALLPRARPVLLVAGDGPERDRLRNLTAGLGLDSEVKWLGHIEGDWKQLCLQGADLFALTSHHENFGLAVLEALAAGTPVLVSPQVALAPAIERHRLGRVASLEPAAIAQAMRLELASARPEARAVRRRFVAETSSWEANARACADWYVKIAKRSLVANVPGA